MISQVKMFCLVVLLFTLITHELSADKIVITTVNSSETPLFKKMALFFDELEKEIDLSLDIELVYMPGKRSSLMLESGEIDGESLRIREAYTNISNVVVVELPLAFIDYFVFTKKDIIIKDESSLAPYRLVFLRGYLIVENYIKDKQFKEIHRVSRVEQIFQMLDRDRADIAIHSYQGGQTILMSEEFKNSGIKVVRPPIITLPLYLFLNEKHAPLIPHLERAIKKVVESGRYKEILGLDYR